jgi:hypothetical protein
MYAAIDQIAGQTFHRRRPYHARHQPQCVLRLAE